MRVMTCLYDKGCRTRFETDGGTASANIDHALEAPILDHHPLTPVCRISPFAGRSSLRTARQLSSCSPPIPSSRSCPPASGYESVDRRSASGRGCAFVDHTSKARAPERCSAAIVRTANEMGRAARQRPAVEAKNRRESLKEILSGRIRNRLANKSGNLSRHKPRSGGRGRHVGSRNLSQTPQHGTFFSAAKKSAMIPYQDVVKCVGRYVCCDPYREPGFHRHASSSRALNRHRPCSDPQNACGCLPFPQADLDCMCIDGSTVSTIISAPVADGNYPQQAESRGSPLCHGAGSSRTAV
ncbi:hypothetical protein QBC47DRAFT_66052 [Echria macrotheca]|uniref:Uncharacterized protein n=1 Tax=Echria macrotheca TaxID=438768 RepID=A0AAJ0F294_9PEZI|nr:hypothetical protein QBC47DRAFT_66052 [Echria macrotheca]